MHFSLREWAGSLIIMIFLKPRDFKSLGEILARMEKEVTIVYFTREAHCRHCRQEREFLMELAELSRKLHLEIHDFTSDNEIADAYGVDKVPGFVLVGEKDFGIRYYGMPSDFEFNTLLEDIEQISSGVSGLSPKEIEHVGKINTPVHLEVITTPTCPFSERAVRLAHQMAMESSFITADLVNTNDFPEVAKRYRVTAAPSVIVNGEHKFYGVLDAAEFVEQILKSSGQTEKENYNG